MIFESSPWKDDLIKISQKLDAKQKQKKWFERSYYSLEKDLFISFYAIRKLIDAKKISNSSEESTYVVKFYPKALLK